MLEMAIERIADGRTDEKARIGDAVREEFRIADRRGIGCSGPRSVRAPGARCRWRRGFPLPCTVSGGPAGRGPAGRQSRARSWPWRQSRAADTAVRGGWSARRWVRRRRTRGGRHRALPAANRYVQQCRDALLDRQCVRDVRGAHGFGNVRLQFPAAACGDQVLRSASWAGVVIGTIARMRKGGPPIELFSHSCGGPRSVILDPFETHSAPRALPMQNRLTIATSLPEDRASALLVGRVFVPAFEGPALVVLRGDDVLDLSSVAPTASALMNLPDPAAAVRAADSCRALAASRKSSRIRTRARGCCRDPGCSPPTTCRRSRRPA